MQPKRRILHLISQRPDSTGSGTCLRAMVREATASRHESFVVAGIQSDRPAHLECPSMVVTFGEGDIPHPIVGMSDVMPYPSRRFRDLSPEDLREYETAFSRRIQDAVSTFRPDIIHSHHLWILTSLARRLLPAIPMVTTCHGSDLRQFQTCPHLQERVLRGCRDLDAVLALSRAQMQEIVPLYDLPPDRVTVVGAGYDWDLFHPHPKPDPDPVRVVYAGKLSDAKGVPWLLRALSTIDDPAWTLHLVGGGAGEEARICRRMAGEMGVVVHGPLPQDELADVMGQAHLLVLPSFYEGLPLIVLEGIASGCRVVATDLPGTTELLGDVDVEFVTLVRTPRLHDLDRPYGEDEGRFEEDLAGALRGQMRSARDRPDIDLSPVRERLTSYSWPGVFRRVQEVYSRLLKS